MDGAHLQGAWFLPPQDLPRMAIVIAPGGGIPARYYHGLATYLAGKNAAVLCFDYRGIGASRRGTLKGLDASLATWVNFDLDGALAHAHAKFGNIALGVITHSIAAIMIGATSMAPLLSRAVFFAPHTAYWGDYRRHWRWPLYLTWHALMPTVTRLVGYFPASAFGLGEDLPKGFALDWASRRRPEVINTAADRARWGELLARLGRMRAETLAVSITDDAFAPPDAGRRLLALYPNLRSILQTVKPAHVGRRRLGHMAFLRRSTGPYFWERAAAWLLQDRPDGQVTVREKFSPAASHKRGSMQTGSVSNQ
jgi:predicted alpha/beta hydrolase